MKCLFEKSLFGENQYCPYTESDFLVESYLDGRISLKSLCEKAGLQEEYQDYKDGKISRQTLEEGIFGAIGRGISAIQRGWNGAKQDYKDARMSGRLDAMNQRLADYQRRQQMMQQQRQKWQRFKEDPAQFQRTATSQALTNHNVEDAQNATVNAKTAHTADVQAQDLNDTREAALRAGTDMYGNEPIESMDVEMTGQLGQDSQAVDQALNQVQNYLRQLNTTTDPNTKAALLNAIYQASSAGAAQVSGRLDSRGAASKGGQTTMMKDGRNNRMAVQGRRLQTPGGAPRGGRGARMGRRPRTTTP